jgi:hypothetical protein
VRALRSVLCDCHGKRFGHNRTVRAACIRKQVIHRVSQSAHGVPRSLYGRTLGGGSPPSSAAWHMLLCGTPCALRATLCITYFTLLRAALFQRVTPRRHTPAMSPPDCPGRRQAQEALHGSQRSIGCGSVRPVCPCSGCPPLACRLTPGLQFRQGFLCTPPQGQEGLQPSLRRRVPLHEAGGPRPAEASVRAATRRTRNSTSPRCSRVASPAASLAWWSTSRDRVGPEPLMTATNPLGQPQRGDSTITI